MIFFKWADSVFDGAVMVFNGTYSDQISKNRYRAKGLTWHVVAETHLCIYCAIFHIQIECNVGRIDRFTSCSCLSGFFSILTATFKMRLELRFRGPIYDPRPTKEKGWGVAYKYVNNDMLLFL